MWLVAASLSLPFALVFRCPCLDRLTVMHSQIVENQKNLALGLFDQRVFPWLVTVAIIDRLWRVPPTVEVTGVFPAGA